MMGNSLDFDRPALLQATNTPEERGMARDEVRLLVSDAKGLAHYVFRDLPELLRPGDLLVVNESATVPASLPARASAGEFLFNLSTRYADDVWLAETRWSASVPGPVPMPPGESFDVAGVRVRMIAPYPGIQRLAFYRTAGDLGEAMRREGSPIRYGYLSRSHPLTDYQTVFARVPGSSEMPSAARPFARRTLTALSARGVDVARIWLHTGVSSLELEPSTGGVPPVYPEPFEVPVETARSVASARCRGGRVIAVGTTVLRALETAASTGEVRPLRGFTSRVLGPGQSFRTVDALLTGLHDPRTSHLSLLFGFGGETAVRAAYADASSRGYLWHEFGDSHLVWRND